MTSSTTLPLDPHDPMPLTPGSNRARPRIDVDAASLPTIARHMYGLMMRNVASDGFRFKDPCPPGAFSQPGCVLAAPSYPSSTPGIDQDYVFNWVRDAAITAIEIAAATDVDDTQALIDYVTFAKTCQDAAAADHDVTLGHACFKVDGQVRDWTEQNDGPAIQTLAILTFFDRLDAPTRAIARSLMQTNVDYLATVYTRATRNLWEEIDGFSFFARSMQLACFRALGGNTAGIDVPPTTGEAIAALETALAAHWNGAVYVSILADPTPRDGDVPPRQDYDPNIDIVCAALYGAVPVTDTKLLATAAALRQQWEDPGSPVFYPINGADKAQGIGPLLGRYPGDHYDGDVAHPIQGGHPWALCTCNVAELYYRVANAIARDGRVPRDDHSAPFFAQVGIAAEAAPDAAMAALRNAGDAMLRAVIHHSDHLELSEQFDGWSGFEKSVRNLTWSYAAFLSAVRARTSTIV